MRLAEMQVELLEQAVCGRGKHPTRDVIKINLIEYVTECTGSPNYDLLSTFLEASRIAHGGANDVEEAEFTTQALQQFSSRYKRIWRQTKSELHQTNSGLIAPSYDESMDQLTFPWAQCAAGPEEDNETT
jgi:hypothetical protein